MIKSKLFKNSIWLYLLQFFNTVIPLLTLPYITRVLGSSNYGLFSFALNIVSYFQVIVDYGFNLSGVRKIALVKSKIEQSRIFSNITFCKFFLCLLSFIFMIIVCLVAQVAKEQLISMIILFTVVIGTAIQQLWLFQGLQIMKYVSIINVVSRTISVIMIFLFVKNSNDIFLYCGLYGITSLLNGLISTFIVYKKINIKFVKVTFADIIGELKDGWYTFISSAMSKVFAGFGITVLGFTSKNESIVGIYSAIQKIPYILNLMFIPLSQSFFPYVSEKFSISFENGLLATRKFSKLIVPFLIILCIILICFSYPIVSILFGKEYSYHHMLLIPLVGWLFFGILNNLLGIQTLVASGYQKEYSDALKIGVLAIILSSIVLGTCLGAYGVAFATLISEIILTFSLRNKIKKILINKNNHGSI